MARTTSKALPAPAAPLTPSQLSERRVCGWLMAHLPCDAGTVRAIGEACKPDDFEGELEGRALATALRVHERGDRVEVVSVAEDMQRHGWRNTGLIDRLTTIVNDHAAQDAESALQAARLVHRAALDRRVQDALSKAQSAAPEQRGAHLARLGELRGELDQCNDDDERLLGWFSEVQPEEPRYLWDQRIPEAALTVLAGVQGLGKSLLSCYLAAAVTRGHPLAGDEHAGRPQGRVLIVGLEDGKGSMQGRLAAAGADLGQVAFISTGRLLLPKDTARIERLIRGRGFVLVIFDPLPVMLEPHLSPNDEAHVKRALLPITDVAQQTGAAMLGIMHLNKGSSDALQYHRVLGSVAFQTVPRSVLQFWRDPDEPRRRVLVQTKVNDSPEGCPALLWRIESVCLAGHAAWDTSAAACPECGRRGRGRLLPVGASRLTIDELVARERQAAKATSKQPAPPAPPADFEGRAEELLGRPEHKGGLSKSKILELLEVADKPAGMKLLAAMVQARKLDMRVDGRSHICSLPQQGELLER